MTMTKDTKAPESIPGRQVLGVATSALYLHLCVPFNAVGIRQNHPALGIDHETGAAGTVLPSSLPGKGKVGSTVNTPDLS